MTARVRTRLNSRFEGTLSALCCEERRYVAMMIAHHEKRVVVEQMGARDVEGNWEWL